MIIIPAIIIGIIYLVLKIFVPVILIIALIVLLYLYFKNRNEADEKIESAKEKINTAKEQATSLFEKAKVIFKWMKKKDNDDEEGQELNDV